MHTFARAAAALLLMILAPGLAEAAPVETGTLAWTNHDIILREGPGNAYDIVGEVEGEIRVRVDRCSNRWCKLHDDGRARGWVSIDELDFGQRPGGPFSGPRFDYRRGGPGVVCFYDGPNFTGAAICAKSGTVVRDLLLYKRDNRISSVSVEGNVSVTLCRDMNFTSFCQMFAESQPTLKGFLDNNVSSYRVY